MEGDSRIDHQLPNPLIPLANGMGRIVITKSADNWSEGQLSLIRNGQKGEVGKGPTIIHNEEVKGGGEQKTLASTKSVTYGSLSIHLYMYISDSGRLLESINNCSQSLEPPLI